MSFKRNLDFFEIYPSDCPLNKILKKISSMPKNDSNNGRILPMSNATAVDIWKYEDNTDYSCGLLVRYRLDDIPLCGNPIKSNIRKIPIESDEGIVDMTYFHYDKDLKIICLLSGRDGAKSGSFSVYVQKKSAVKDFYLLPILTKNASDTLQKFGSLTSIFARIRLGNNIRLESKQVQSLSVSDMAKGLNEQLGTTIFELKLAHPKLDGGLKTKPSKVFIDLLRKLRGQTDQTIDIDSLKIKGSENAETKDTMIDLIKQKYRIDVSLKGSDRQLDFEECKRVIASEIKEHKELLQELI